MMLTIGQFAQVTGLTIKALRHYDSVGLLPPAETDPVNGYRRYDATQISTGAQIGLLRAMNVPLDTIAEYLNESEPQAQVLQQHRQQVLLERQRQDQMWDEAAEVLVDYRIGYQIQERQADALHWVGFVSPVPDTGVSAASHEYIEDMLSALAKRDVRMRGPFWTAFRGDGVTNAVSVILATGIEDPLPATLLDRDQLVSGTLPKRRELFVCVDSASAMSQNLSVPHPGAVALLTAHEHGSLEDFRQATAMTSGGEPCIELVLDIAS